MSNSWPEQRPPDEPVRKSKRTPIIIVLVVTAIVLCVLYTQVGLYTIQPIGAIPDGVTLVVWRNSGEPFFNSPDAVSIEKTGGVSLFSRGRAISEGPKDRIILRLPYQKWAYLQSTGGKEFSK